MVGSFFANVCITKSAGSHDLQAFLADPHPNKISFIIGAYQTNDGLPYVLPVVRKVELAMANDQTLNHEYLPIDGLQDMIDGAVELALGSNSKSTAENRVASIQTISGSGELSLAFKFLKRFYTKSQTVYISNPTWENHKGILSHAGFINICEYLYLDPKTHDLNFSGIIDDLRKAPEYSIVLLQPSAHNPCGIDPSIEEWKTICEVVKTRKLFPVFDFAYQGFVSGNVDKDAWVLRYFDEQNIEMIICQSFSKMFGIYNERCGCLSVLCKDTQIAKNILSQLKIIVRRNYSNPPNHGARIVASILNSESLCSAWKVQLKEMAAETLKRRSLFFDKLVELKVPGNWSHILKQKGMFAFTHLRPKEILKLQEKHHIYMLSNGRINICAINEKNVDYIAKAFKDVTGKCSE